MVLYFLATNQANKKLILKITVTRSAHLGSINGSANYTYFDVDIVLGMVNHVEVSSVNAVLGVSKLRECPVRN